MSRSGRLMHRDRSEVGSMRARCQLLCVTVIAAAVSGCGRSGNTTEYDVLDSNETGDGNDPDASPGRGQDFGNAGSNHVPDPPPRVVTEPDPPESTASGKLAGTFLADAGDDWLSLIEAEWKLDPNSEAHLCARATVPRDAYLHEFAPLIPLGTHHTVLSVHPGGEAPDGVVPCAADVSGRQIFGAGVGTKSETLPDGIAAQVHAGDQLLLNLHMFNASDEPLEGRSGVKVRTMDEADVEDVAEGVLAGPLTLEIPPGGPTKQAGQCTFDHDATIISVGPHMHQLGVHMRVVARSSVAGDTVLFDGPYAFDSQQRYPVDFVEMKAGDVVSVECTYQNDTDHAVAWGQSSLDEMCFASITRFPASDGAVYLCTN
jgi:hypothetical protein